MEYFEEIILKAALYPNLKNAQNWLDYKASTPNSELPNMLNWCGGYIYRNLLSLEIRDEYLKGIYRHNWTSNTYRLQRLSEILNTLNKVSVITPIKSFGLNNKNFNLGLRTIGDFDFYFNIEDLKKIIEVLKTHSFELFMGISDEELFDKILTSRGSWSYKRGAIDDLDLHWKVFDEFDIEFNRRILTDNSKSQTSIWGKHMQLSNEMSSIVISHHHYLQGGSNYSGLCDLQHMLNQADFSKVRILAKQLNMIDIFNSQLELIESFTSEKNHNVRMPTIEHRRGNLKDIISFIQIGTLKRPFLYKAWIMLGAKSKLEKLCIKFFGAFSNPVSYMEKSIKLVELSPSIALGMGWHYRYPGDLFQWTTYPDTRILIHRDLNNSFDLKVELDPMVWSISIPHKVEFFANGIFVGVIDKATNSFGFSLTLKRGWNELSFRAPKPWIRDLTKIDYNWQRMMMPVKSIKIIERTPIQL